jgi:hypothetical protein
MARRCRSVPNFHRASSRKDDEPPLSLRETALRTLPAHPTGRLAEPLLNTDLPREHRKPPHDRERRHRAFQRVRMDVWHALWPRTLEENDRPMRTSRELRRLRKQMSIDQRQREIGVRLPLDN